MISNLAELVSPLSEAEFLSRLQRRELTLLRGARTVDDAALADWEVLRGVVEQGVIPIQDIRVSRESRELIESFYVTQGKADAAKLDSLLLKGASVILNHIHAHVPALAALCGNIEKRTGEKSGAHVVVTTGSGGALKLHYDPEDLVILQLEGSKRWRIEGPAVTNPVTGMTKPPPPSGMTLFDDVLHPGDTLFVPAGNWHHCDNGPGRSIHLGIALTPLSAWELLKPLIREWLDEEDFRVPFARLPDGAALTALEARLKARISATAGRLSLRDHIAGKE